MSDAKSRWQQEYEALPEWARKMVDALSGCASYGGGHDDMLVGLAHPEKFEVFQVALRREKWSQWFSGFLEMRELAGAITAPWPPPEAPKRERRAFNIVELVAGMGDDADCAFDQPCAFGHRVDGHAVYCHNEAWPDSPRKCHRSQRDAEYRHEDCPGFVANPDAQRQPA